MLTHEQLQRWERAVVKSELTHAQKTVLWALKTYADWSDGTNAHPGEIQLAELCGMTTRAIRMALDRGRKLGLIQQTQRENPKAHKAAVYRIVVPGSIGGDGAGSTGTAVPVNNSTTGTTVPVETRSTGTAVPVNNGSTGTAVQVLPERTFLPPETYHHQPRVLRNWGTSPEPTSELAAHTIDPPSKFCPNHPHGTGENCGPCANHRTARKAWDEAQAERDAAIELAEEERRRERRRLIAACPDCDDFGRRDDLSPCGCWTQPPEPLPPAVGHG